MKNWWELVKLIVIHLEIKSDWTCYWYILFVIFNVIELKNRVVILIVWIWLFTFSSFSSRFTKWKTDQFCNEIIRSIFNIWKQHKYGRFHTLPCQVWVASKELFTCFVFRWFVFCTMHNNRIEYFFEESPRFCHFSGYLLKLYMLLFSFILFTKYI